ncbi:DNA polymerase III subunit chi [Rickettsiales bacterium]|nr:DNA polymerase III subunit chi [Rickettsiales bacterium]
MAAINFYHLTKSPVEKALPKLLEKVIQNDQRALVISANAQNTAALNKQLWTYTTKFFLPHGSKEDIFPQEQPIYLTNANDNEHPNGASILVILDNVSPDLQIDNFARCLYLFDGNNDEQTSLARNHWKELKKDGHELVYWQQNEKGKWEEGA